MPQPPLDPRRQAEQDVAEAEARMREWVRTRRTYAASMPFAGAPDEYREVRQFTVTVQPFVGGPKRRRVRERRPWRMPQADCPSRARVKLKCLMEVQAHIR